MTANARRLAAAGQLPAGLTVEQAADVLWTYSSPDLFDLLVRRSGWDLRRSAAFVNRRPARPPAGARGSGAP